MFLSALVTCLNGMNHLSGFTPVESLSVLFVQLRFHLGCGVGSLLVFFQHHLSFSVDVVQFECQFDPLEDRVFGLPRHPGHVCDQMGPVRIP